MAGGVFNPIYGFASSAPNGATNITQYVSALTGFAAPANAVAFLFQSDDTNGGNIRWRLGAAASTVSGHQYEPGRDSGYVPFSGGTFSVCPEGGAGVTLGIQLTWFTLT